MKILVANIGSTSLKYRLFDFSSGDAVMLTKGGFERVTDYAATIEQCLSELVDGGFIAGEEDLAAAKAYLVARVPFGRDTAGKRLNKLMESFFLGTPEDYWDTYVERIQAVTVEAAREVVSRRRHPNSLVVVAVCTADGFADRLAKAGLVFDEAKIIPARELL